MKKRIYLETSFISYLVSEKQTRDMVIEANKQITREWWIKRKNDFELFISEFVIQEAKKGDSNASNKRILLLETLPILAATEEVLQLSEKFLRSKIIPKKAAQDSVHISISTIHGMDYLLTWNCTHIANAEIQKSINKICVTEGFEMPIICTPFELMGD
ncbi:MAG: type II toxin-antitoxin system VapC family toxin [Candidatus Riflebacteria bacterium]|nr:type II toxin-antitoxin system VapC family toxin [Candidatus Riflebacteria bacterium]